MEYVLNSNIEVITTRRNPNIRFLAPITCNIMFTKIPISDYLQANVEFFQNLAHCEHQWMMPHGLANIYFQGTSRAEQSYLQGDFRPQ